MNIQTPFTHDQINLMLQEPFALNCRIPGVVQEEIGKRLSQGVAPHLRKGAHPPRLIPPSKSAGEDEMKAYVAAMTKRRAALAPRVLALLSEGLSRREIVRRMGIAAKTVRRIINEASQ